MKKLICIQGSGKWPEDEILFIEDLNEVVNGERIKRIIIERCVHAEGEDPNQSLEIVRIELNQKKAAIFWNSLWQYDFKKYIHVDVTEDPNIGVYIVKSEDELFSRKNLTFTDGRVETKNISIIAEITLTEQRSRRLKEFLLEDWLIPSE